MTEAERASFIQRLRFPRELELQFQAVYFHKILKPLQIGLGLVSFILLFELVTTIFARGVPAPLDLAIIALIPFTFGISFLPIFFKVWKPLLAIVAATFSIWFLVANMPGGAYQAENYPTSAAQMVRIGYILLIVMVPAALVTRLPFYWTTAVLAAIEGGGVWYAQSVPFDPSAWSSLLTNTLTPLIVLMLSALAYERYNRSDFISNRLLAEEQAKSEALLLNILPESIAGRLKQNSEAIAEGYAEVSILFADIVGFTPLSASLPAHDLVHLLNRVFSRFDELAELHKVEKIKTIGDAYMVVSGLPEANEKHACTIAAMALDMTKAIGEFEGIEGEPLKLRIGINSGPVVAGVIGTKRFLYDLWGDAVNVASRMESHGAAGRIMISDTTKSLLDGTFRVSEARVIEVKGKGQMKTYELLA